MRWYWQSFGPFRKVRLSNHSLLGDVVNRWGFARNRTHFSGERIKCTAITGHHVPKSRQPAQALGATAPGPGCRHSPLAVAATTTRAAVGRGAQSTHRATLQPVDNEAGDAEASWSYDRQPDRWRHALHRRQQHHPQPHQYAARLLSYRTARRAGRRRHPGRRRRLVWEGFADHLQASSEPQVRPATADQQPSVDLGGRQVGWRSSPAPAPLPNSRTSEQLNPMPSQLTSRTRTSTRW